MGGKTAKLTDLVEDIANSGDGDKIKVRDMLEAIESRGFGPLIAVPALLAMPPIGALPGVPAIAGVVIALIAVQMVLGFDSPWLPKWILDRGFDRAKFEDKRPKVEKVTKVIDKAIKPRLKFLASDGSNRLVALICVALGLSMPFVGILPMAALAPAAAVIAFGVGLSAKDGLLMLIGYIAAGITIYLGTQVL